MIKDELLNDFKQAMKSGNTVKKNTIQLIRAHILQKEKDNHKSLTDTEIQDILMKERKKRLESINDCEKANRMDLKEQYSKELQYINSYLPQPISDFELQMEVDNTIKELNATSKDKGLVIRTLKSKLGSRVDPKHLSEVVINTLNKLHSNE